ncbi:MAG: ATP-dependent sacrificial sulfur transferase LarE [Acidobacteriota bacterium]|nr:ATP-dependent sacrificial sulfur transferase LarE [Acidobacteriota bacterium]
MNKPEPDRRGIDAKLELLRAWIRDHRPLVVAYSGGVDSALLTRVAVDEVGDDVVAALAVGPSLPRRERVIAERMARAMGVRLEILETREFEDERYLSNAGDRCYWCRSALVEALRPYASRRGAHLAYGAVPEDLGDDRPGMRAAEEGGVSAPLIEVGLTKKEVRELARRYQLEVWDKPASACLSSRVEVGERVTPGRLARIEAAEDGLLAMGFRQVRVRDHGTLARIEVGRDELERLLAPETRQRVAALVRQAGFEKVAVDLEGYRPAGSAGRLPALGE